MNDVPRQMLREIVAKYGKDIVEQRERCKGLLLDYCSEYRRETNVLIAVLDENVVRDMLTTSTPIATSMLLTHMIQRVYDGRGLDKDAARWGVESWALALGLQVDTQTAAAQSTPQQPLPAPSATNTPQQSTPTSTLKQAPRQTTNPTKNSNTRQQPAPLPAYSSPTAPVNRQRPIQAESSITPVRRRSYRRTGFLEDLFPVALGLGLFIVGARTITVPFDQDLLAASIYLTTALIGYKRAFLAYLLYIAAGTINIPVFLGESTVWSWNNLLIFTSGQGGFFSLHLLYYYLSLIVLLIVGVLFQNNRSRNIWGTVGILLLGNLLFALLIVVIDLVSQSGGTIGVDLGAYEPDSLVLLLILLVPVYIINVIKS